MNTTTLKAHYSTIHLLLTVAGAAGVAALFLPFTAGVSPVDAMWYHGESDELVKELWRLAAPFFLSILISGASIRWAASGSLARPERWIAYIVSIAMASLTLSALSVYMPYVAINESPRPQEWVSFGLPPITLLLGLLAVIKNARFGSLPEMGGVTAMQMAYLANSLLCLVSFFGDWQIGAYCGLLTSAVYLVQIVLVCVQPRVVRSPGMNP